MRQVHRAGEKTFIDFSGKRPTLVDPRTARCGASSCSSPCSARWPTPASSRSRPTRPPRSASRKRFGLLVDAEWTAREQRKLQRRLRTAKLRHPATLEAVDFTHPRRLNRQQVLTLGACAWVAERHNLILIGPTGIGKSFLGCAFVERACRRGFTARYVRMPRLLHELAVGRGDGSYARLLARLAFDLAS